MPKSRSGSKLKILQMPVFTGFFNIGILGVRSTDFFRFFCLILPKKLHKKR